MPNSDKEDINCNDLRIVCLTRLVVFCSAAQTYVSVWDMTLRQGFWPTFAGVFAIDTSRRSAVAEPCEKAV